MAHQLATMAAWKLMDEDLISPPLLINNIGADSTTRLLLFVVCMIMVKTGILEEGLPVIDIAWIIISKLNFVVSKPLLITGATQSARRPLATQKQCGDCHVVR
jgi:hypothetical protein